MKFWGILLGILGVAGIAGFLVLSNLHTGEHLTEAQKQKALSSLLGRAAVVSPVDHATWKAYTSPVAGFSYPGWSTVYTNDNTNAKKQANMLDSFHFGLLDMHMEGIVSVLSRPSFTHVSDEPAVSLRIQDQSYERIGTASGNVAQFLHKGDSLERSAFILKNGKVYSLIISGGSVDDMQEIFEKIYTSLVFK